MSDKPHERAATATTWPTEPYRAPIAPRPPGEAPRLTVGVAVGTASFAGDLVPSVINGEGSLKAEIVGSVYTLLNYLYEHTGKRCRITIEEM